METPAALVENASLADCRVATGTLGDIPRLAAALGRGPALVLLGDVLRGLVAIGAKDLEQDIRAA